MKQNVVYRALGIVLAAVIVLSAFSACGDRRNAAGQTTDPDTTTQTAGKPDNSTEASADQTTTDAPTDTTPETTTDTQTDPTPETTTGENTDTTPETTDEPPVDITDAPVVPPETQPPQIYTPVPLTGALPENGSVDGSFFNDAVFVGDSVSLKLSYYEAAVDKLGTAQFLTSGSLGSGNALWAVSDDSVHPSFQGTKMLLEQSVPLTGAKKMYIMLGMNDIALYGIDASVSNMVTLIQRIQAAAPGLTVYVQSMTPMTSTSNILSASGHNPQNVQRYNEALLSACQSNGWYFVNVGEVMYDANGYLRRDYCSDPDGMGIHFTNIGCEAWISYLYTHTAG